MDDRDLSSSFYPRLMLNGPHDGCCCWYHAAEAADSTWHFAVVGDDCDEDEPPAMHEHP